jgi:hypothetical protein
MPAQTASDETLGLTRLQTKESPHVALADSAGRRLPLMSSPLNRRAKQGPPGRALRVDLDEFLYAPVYEEAQGMTLSVLSALARLGHDPWERAAMLASHTREAAAQELALLMSALPEWGAPGHDGGSTVARLAALLPGNRANISSSPQAAPNAQPADRASNFMWIYAIIMLLLISAQWISARSHRDPPDPVPQAAVQTAAPTTPSGSQPQ